MEATLGEKPDKTTADTSADSASKKADKKAGQKKHGRTAFCLVIKPGAVKLRKPLAPAGGPLPAKRDKKPRHRPDYLEETE